MFIFPPFVFFSFVLASSQCKSSLLWHTGSMLIFHPSGPCMASAIYASTLAYIVDANVGRSSIAVASNASIRGLAAFVATEAAVPLQVSVSDTHTTLDIFISAIAFYRRWGSIYGVGWSYVVLWSPNPSCLVEGRCLARTGWAKGSRTCAVDHGTQGRFTPYIYILKALGRRSMMHLFDKPGK